MENSLIIIGAGPAGLSLANLLAQKGIPCTVLDHAVQNPASVRDDNRTAALLRPSVDILARAGVDAQSLEGTAPLIHLRLIDVPVRANKTTFPRYDFSSTEIDEPYFGLNIKNAPLHQALLKQALKNPLITLIAPVQIEKFEVSPTSITVHTDTGAYTASLVIGADGKKSRVRDLAGIQIKKHDYDQIAITCMVAHDRPHHDTSIEFHRPGGPFTLVPLKGNESSVVWMERADEARKILSLSPNDFNNRLQQESHDELGTLRALNTPQSWPIYLMQAEKLTAPRVVLVAEAAHAIPPSGAQGLNLSLRDIEQLTEHLVRATRLGLDLGSPLVLAGYERQRIHDMAPRVHAVDGLNRFILSSSPLIRHLRGIGLHAAASIPPFRRAIMHFGWAAA